jgi:hypothetical protein
MVNVVQKINIPSQRCARSREELRQRRQVFGQRHQEF